MNRRAWLGSFLAVNVRLARTDGPYEDFDPARYQVTVVVFVSTICPVSNAYVDRLKALISQTKGRPVQWLFANANDNESASDTARYAADIKLPVLVDRYGQMADRFGAVMTPESVVLNREGEVVYKGAIDDAQNPARVKIQALRDAIEAVLNGRPVPNRNLRAFGCAIHRKDSK